MSDHRVKILMLKVYIKIYKNVLPFLTTVGDDRQHKYYTHFTDEIIESQGNQDLTPSFTKQQS